jgi:hypothetical protein
MYNEAEQALIKHMGNIRKEILEQKEKEKHELEQKIMKQYEKETKPPHIACPFQIVLLCY